MSMTVPTIATGLILTLIGVSGYLGAAEDKVSPTALIPAGFGLALVAIGMLVAAKPTVRKHAMHGAAAVGLFGAISGLAPIIVGLAKGNGVNFGKSSVQHGLAMSVVCLLFVGLCVKSFVDARRARAVTPPATS
jgi:hypothetical protein